MQIQGPIPFHVAQAYGIQPVAPALRTPSRSPIEPAAPIARDTTSVPETLKALVGGKVRQSIDFDGVSTPMHPAGEALPLYTRSADRVEAATGVRLGRGLDIKG